MAATREEGGGGVGWGRWWGEWGAGGASQVDGNGNGGHSSPADPVDPPRHGLQRTPAFPLIVNSHLFRLNPRIKIQERCGRSESSVVDEAADVHRTSLRSDLFRAAPGSRARSARRNFIGVWPTASSEEPGLRDSDRPSSGVPGGTFGTAGQSLQGGPSEGTP